MGKSHPPFLPRTGDHAIPVLRPDWSAPANVQALCTTRVGGDSNPPFDTLNLGTHVGDHPQTVQRNRTRHQQLMGVATVYLQQVHGTTVLPLTGSNSCNHNDSNDNGGGCGDGSNAAAIADACCTRDKGLACTIMVADCLPVLFTNHAGTAVAAAHAGWRGLSNGILENTVAALAELSSETSNNIIAWLGPCIGRTAFEVGADVYQAFVQQHAADAQAFGAWTHAHSGVTTGTARYWCDLAQLARNRLHRTGINRCFGNDSRPMWCTHVQRQRYFSHRRDSQTLGATGRMAVSIWMR